MDSARKLSRDEALALAESHLQGFEDQKGPPEDFRQWGLTARVNDVYRERIEQNKEFASHLKAATTIGEPMPKAQWSEARDILGGKQARIYLPKIHTDYAGKVIFVTDTHVVQQSSKSTAVAHELAKLQNGPQILEGHREGKVQGQDPAGVLWRRRRDLGGDELQPGAGRRDHGEGPRVRRGNLPGIEEQGGVSAARRADDANGARAQPPAVSERAQSPRPQQRDQERMR